MNGRWTDDLRTQRQYNTIPSKNANGTTSGFWLSPLSRERLYDCLSYRSMHCFNASSERYPCSFHFFIGYAEWHPLASPPEVSQSFKEVPSTLRSVGAVHWARAVASALGVCLAGIRPAGKVRRQWSGPPCPPRSGRPVWIMQTRRHHNASSAQARSWPPVSLQCIRVARRRWMEPFLHSHLSHYSNPR